MACPNKQTRIDVRVDTDMCMASGACLASLPEVFSAAPDGVAEVRCDNPDPALLDQIKLAAAACPTFAISVTVIED